MKNLKTIALNTLGIIAGLIAGKIAVELASFLFIDLIGQLGIIRNLISHPVSYDTYAFSAIIFADFGASVYICYLLCKLGKGKYNTGCLILGIIKLIYYIIILISSISANGFSFDIVWTFIISLIGFGFITFSLFANDEE